LDTVPDFMTEPAPPPEGPKYYVDPEAGDDELGDGTQQRPFRTFSHVMTLTPHEVP
jgi:hypothetical protein